jgi:hypothetical protein
MYINSCLINYAIKYSSQLLANPNVFMKHNLNTFINENIINTKLDNRFKNDLAGDLDNYLYSRKKFIESRNAKGDIIANEDLFICNHSINFESNETEKKPTIIRDNPGLADPIIKYKALDLRKKLELLDRADMPTELKWTTINSTISSVDTATSGITSYEITIDGRLKPKAEFNQIIEDIPAPKEDDTIFKF